MQNIRELSEVHGQRHDIFDQIHDLYSEMFIGRSVEHVHEDEFSVHFDGVTFLVGHPNGFKLDSGNQVSELVDDGLDWEPFLHGFKEGFHKSIKKKLFEFFF